MKYNKTFLFILLTTGLHTSLYSFDFYTSWSLFKTKVENTFSSFSLEKYGPSIMVGALLGGLIGKIWGNKPKPASPQEPQVVNASEFMPCPAAKKFNIQQEEVLKQQNDALCAYHALKNGTLLSGMTDTNKEAVQEKLNDNFHFDLLLSSWKKTVMDRRRAKRLATYFHDEITEKIITNKTGKHSRTFIQTIDRHLNAVAESYFENKNTEHINAKTLKNNLAETLSKNIAQNVLKEETSYIDYSKFSPINLDSAYIQKLMDEGKLTVVNDWLQGDEVDELAKKNSGGVAKNALVLDSLNQINFVMPPDLPAQWKRNPNFKQLFILGTSEQQTDTFGTRGHWFTLYGQKRNNTPSFIVTDSLGVDRTKDPHVQYTIYKLTH